MTDSIEQASGDMADRIARVALNQLAEPGNRLIWSLVQQDGAPAALQQLLSGDVPDQALMASVRGRTNQFDPRRFAEASLRRAERLDVRLVVPSDEEWPEQVNDLATLETGAPGSVHHNMRPPLCLWVRGFPPLHKTLQRSVAVTGSRGATPYGLQTTTDIAYGLAQQGWTVVSGGAFGAEAAAHRAALAAEGRTVAVLACGMDRPYPAGNSALFDQIIDSGGLLVSEWPLGSEPLRHRFFLRNRVVAAATAGTVVTEAIIRSGAIQTMKLALGLRRIAMAVPGPVTSQMSTGCHEMLRTHPDAVLVTGLSHVLEAINGGAEPDIPAQDGRDRLDDESAKVLRAMTSNSVSTPEGLAVLTELPLRIVLRRLSLLELAGLVKRRDDGVTRTARPE
jgi:DNA processing protein